MERKCQRDTGIAFDDGYHQSGTSDKDMNSQNRSYSKKVNFQSADE